MLQPYRLLYVELDALFHVLTYKEHTPYGSTSYQGISDTHLPPKLSRFFSATRDDESSFYARYSTYYLPLLSRFLNPNPAGFAGGTNLYNTAMPPATPSCSPIRPDWARTHRRSTGGPMGGERARGRGPRRGGCR